MLNRNKISSVVAGSKCVDGYLEKKNGFYRVLRDQNSIFNGPCTSLKRHKLDVERVGKGSEFGIVLDDFKDYKQVINFYVWDIKIYLCMDE